MPRSRRPHHNPRAIGLDRRGPDRPAPQRALQAGPGRRRRDHPQPSPGTQGADPASPATVSTIWRVLTRRGFVIPQPRKRPKGVVHRFAGRPAQRTLAGRHHPLAPRRRHRRGDPQPPRRPLPPRAAIQGPSAPPPAPTSWPTFRTTFRRHGIPAQRAHRQRRDLHRQTPRRRTGRPGDRARPARCPTRTTHGPTTPRPRARSNASTRPRRSGSPPNHPPPTIAALQRQLDRFRRYYNDRPPPPRPRPPTPRPRPTPPAPKPSPPSQSIGTALPSPPRQGRHLRHHHHSLRQPTTPHRTRPRTPRQTRPGPARRPAHPRHRRRDRRTTPRAHPRPHQGLPTPRPQTRTPRRSPEMQRCLATPVNGVARHHIRWS